MMSDSEQFSNRFELDLSSLLVNFSCELVHAVTRLQTFKELCLINGA